MGISFAKMFQQIFATQEMKLAMVGLDGAGKTTILYKFKLSGTITTIPTIGFNVETVECNNVSFTVWDVGGPDKLRRLWGHYYEGADGVVFVVDSNDRDRIDDAKEELQKVITTEMIGAPVLILANKQDLPNAMSLKEIAENLGVGSLRKPKLHIQPCVATTGHGLEEGMAWLHRALHSAGFPEETSSAQKFSKKLETRIGEMKENERKELKAAKEVDLAGREVDSDVASTADTEDLPAASPHFVA
mmetsp:Transcript_27409/g.40906  ORF Transcript_27409/g.40906 Transcript_27409/m.40906 type:complete len:246 (-) Transcript_27409:373-1110(-)